nr:hypothetical protein BaRGS_017538 [Batillaria attramentaria]
MDSSDESEAESMDFCLEITGENLEDLLAYDDLFLDYFNAFLALPVFPQALVYNRLTGAFEEVDENTPDASGNLPAGHPASLHYGATDLEREKMLEWARQERLPLFLKTQLFRELKLVKLLLRPLEERQSASRGSSRNIRGYSRQTETYVSSLSNSADNSGNDVLDEDDLWDEFSVYDDEEDDFTLVRSASTKRHSHRKSSSAVRSGKSADKKTDTAKATRALSAPVTYEQFQKMPPLEFPDFDAMFGEDEPEPTGQAYVTFEDDHVSEEQTETDMRNMEGRLKMTIQQMKEQVLSARPGFERFREFLGPTSGYHLLDFWLDCENFKDMMEDFDDNKQREIASMLYRDIQDKYKLKLTQDAKDQITRSTSNMALSHTIFLRTQYDVLRRLRAYWLPRYLTHCERTNALQLEPTAPEPPPKMELKPLKPTRPQQALFPNISEKERTNLHKTLQAARDFIEASIFDTAKTQAVTKLEKAWIRYLKEDLKAFLDCRVRMGGESPPSTAEAIEITVTDQDVLIKRPRPWVRRYPGSAASERARRLQKALILAEDIDDERRAEKKREALERRKEMERERKKAIRAAYARQREAKKKKPGASAKTQKSTGEGEEQAGEDGTDGAEKGEEKEKAVTYQDLSSNRQVMSMFRKYLADIDSKEITNLMHLYQEIEGYFSVKDAKQKKGGRGRTYIQVSDCNVILCYK